MPEDKDPCATVSTVTRQEIEDIEATLKTLMETFCGNPAWYERTLSLKYVDPDSEHSLEMSYRENILEVVFIFGGCAESFQYTVLQDDFIGQPRGVLQKKIRDWMIGIVNLSSARGRDEWRLG